MRWSFVTLCKAHHYPCLSRCSSSFRRRFSSCSIVSFDMLCLFFDRLCWILQTCVFKFRCVQISKTVFLFGNRLSNALIANIFRNSRFDFFKIKNFQQLTVPKRMFHTLMFKLIFRFMFSRSFEFNQFVRFWIGLYVWSREPGIALNV